jgi:hypothetical protein
MRERQLRRVQELPLELRFRDPVSCVTDDGKVDRGEVDANLVRPAGLEANPQQRVPPDQLFHLEVRRRLSGLIRVERPARRIGSVAADGGLDPAPPRTWAPAHERDVGSLQLAPADEVLEAPVRLARAGDDEEARRVPIEPVHDPRPLGVLSPGGSTLQQSVDERAVSVTGRGMDDDTGGLVHDEEVLVLEDHAQVDLLRLERVGLGLRQVDLEGLAAREPPALRRGRPLDAHRACGDQPLGRRARADLGALGQEAIEPRTGRVVRNAQQER